MLPTKQLLPCVRALAELVHRYGCTVVLCTATQPSLGEMFASYGCPVREIAHEPQALYERLRRTEYRFVGKIEDEALADRLASHKQALCVVNSRKQAKALTIRRAGSWATTEASTICRRSCIRRIGKGRSLQSVVGWPRGRLAG